MTTEIEDINDIVKEVVRKVQSQLGIEIESNEIHVHLSRQDIDSLFGSGYQLTKIKNLSQPGQFVCQEQVNLVGPKGILKNVSIIGPEREETQVEVSKTDALILGIKVPIRESGHTFNTPGVLMMNGVKSLRISKGLIIAKRHIHLTLEDAERFGVKQGEIVQVKINGERPLIFDDVVIRIHPNYAKIMHIDSDEANACGYRKGIRGTIIKKTGDNHG